MPTDLPARIRDALQHPALTGEGTLRDLLREALEEIDHWRVKATAYGGIVHACQPALVAAGHPVDASGSDGAVGGIARAVRALVVERDAALARAAEALADCAVLAEALRWVTRLSPSTPS